MEFKSDQKHMGDIDKKMWEGIIEEGLPITRGSNWMPTKNITQDQVIEFRCLLVGCGKRTWAPHNTITETLAIIA